MSEGWEPSCSWWGVLVLVMAGMAAAQTLHAPRVGTVAQCDGLVTWQFVHNRMEATSGTDQVHIPERRVRIGEQ